MKFVIYGLRVKGDSHVFLVGQTHQKLYDRKNNHVRRARSMFAGGHRTPKTEMIMAALQNGDNIEIFQIDEIETEPVYVGRPDNRYPIASAVVHDLETYWTNHYLKTQGGPMVVEGRLMY